MGRGGWGGRGAPHRVGFLHRFGLKTGIHFGHFGPESGMVFEGTTGVYVDKTRQEKTMFYLESYTVLCISTLSK